MNNNFKMVMDYSEPMVKYYRTFHPLQTQICNQLVSYYNQNLNDINIRGIICPSGMFAISSTFNSLLINNNFSAEIVYGNEIYCDTKSKIKQLTERYNGVNSYPVMVSDDTMLEQVINKMLPDKLKIVFLESLTNPSTQIYNIELLKRLKELHNFILIIDNTMATHVRHNPFEYNTDIILFSTTKDYSGGNCIGGAIVAKESYGKDIQQYVRDEGGHVSPYNCSIVLNNMNQMIDRISYSSSITTLLAKYLDNNKNDIMCDISHNSLTSHKSYKIIENYIKYMPSTLLITFKYDTNKLEQIIKKYSPMMTSYGGSHSSFDSWPIKKKKKKIYRFSVGYDDTFKNLKNIFDSINRDLSNNELLDNSLK